jgi:glycosyltransferase involved in cell wall biosynthesis
MVRQLAISAVVPAYNEAGNIAATLTQLHQFLEENSDAFEIIVVDDGSRDGTGSVVEQTIHRAKLSPLNIQIINHPQNMGYGGALRSGFYKAKHDWILLYPGDGQFQINEIELLIDAMKKVGGRAASIVWGYRKQRAEGKIRKFLGKKYRQLIDDNLGVHLRDIDCGFKLYHRKVFYEIPTLTAEGRLIDAEILYYCRQLNIPIREIGVKHLKRKKGRSTGLDPSVLMKMFKELKKFQDRLKNK